MTKTVGIVIFIGILLGNAALAYQPHLTYPYPLISDEYAHISLGERLSEDGVLPFTNPYFSAPTKHTNFESGFHVLLATLFTIIPGEPVLLYKYFVILFALINSVLVFYVTRALTESNTAALSAMFFFGSIKSTSGLLAQQYFIPLTVGVTLLLLLFIFLHQLVTKKEKKYIALLIVTLLVTVLTYPPSLFFFLGTTLVYLFSMDHALHELCNLSRKRFFLYTALIVGVLTIVFVSLLYGFDLLSKGFFPASWDVVQVQFSPLLFFGVTPLLFSTIGLISIATTTRGSAKILLYWFIFSLGALHIFYFTSVSVLIPSQRLFIFYLVGVSMLAGVGVATTLRCIHDRWGGSFWPRVATAALVVVCILHFDNVWAKPINHPAIVTPQLYEALLFLREFTQNDAVIIADPSTSLSIYPVSKRHVVNVLDSNTSGGKPQIAHVFLTGMCSEKKDIYPQLLEQMALLNNTQSPLYVLSPTPQRCDFLTPVYDKDPYIYSVGL